MPVWSSLIKFGPEHQDLPPLLQADHQRFRLSSSSLPVGHVDLTASYLADGKNPWWVKHQPHPYRVLEFGAVNVTGFRLIDPQSEFVSQFNRQWKKYPLAASSGPPVWASKWFWPWNHLRLTRKTQISILLNKNRHKSTDFPPQESISAIGALAYDSVYVMESAFNSLLKQDPSPILER